MVNTIANTVQIDTSNWASGQLVSNIRAPAIYFANALNFKNENNAVVCGTINRDEGAYVGYFGKVSDSVVDLQLIFDIHKSEVNNLATYFQKRNALLQICIDPGLIDPLYIETPCKFNYLTNSIKDLIDLKNNKIVIWSVYTKTIDRLVKDYARYNPARIDGQIDKVSDRKLMVDRFQNDDLCKIFIGNPAAAGAGITLHKASTAIYLSYSSQAAHYMQSLDRIHRRGQIAAEVNYFFLVGKNTIESKEIKRLLEKQERQSTLLGDSEDEIIELSKIIAELEND
jgi:SNF2 family DNA or RNA helicase